MQVKLGKKVENSKRHLCLLKNDTNQLTWFEIAVNGILIGCLIAYLFIGALILTLTENPEDATPKFSQLNSLYAYRNRSYFDPIRQETIENIWDVTVSLNILYRNNWTRLAAIELRKFEDRYMEKISKYYERLPKTEVSIHWTLPQSFLYCLLLLTTTGMPNIYLSLSGKVVTTIFVLLGIPLMILYLSMAGVLLSKLGRIVARKLFCCSSDDIPKKDTTSNHVVDPKLFYVNDMLGFDQKQLPQPKNTKRILDMRKSSICWPLLTLLMIFTGYISAGFVALRWTDPEFWTLFETFYFSFLSLSTVSFGSEEQRLRIFQMGHESSSIFWLCSIYILFGLSFLSTFFHVIYDQFFLQ